MALIQLNPQLAPAPPKPFTMMWTPRGQIMAAGVDSFSHEGAIRTAPAHDLAHLLCAAQGIRWRPVGEQPEIALAEFNAVTHEHILDRVYRCTIEQEYPEPEVVRGLLTFLEWFTTDFTPFPTTSIEALRMYLASASDESTLRLSPLFFAQKHAERQDAAFMQSTWQTRFHAFDRPSGWQECQRVTQRQLQQLRAVVR